MCTYQDEVGIVAKLSECIASRGGNILTADIFVPEKKNVFYSRRYVPLLIRFHIQNFFNIVILYPCSISSYKVMLWQIMVLHFIL